MKRVRDSRLTFGFLALSVAIAPTAGMSQSGKDQLTTSPEIFESLRSCRDIADDVARLACFDRTIGPLSAAVEAKQVIVVEEADVARTKKSLFGFKLPAIALFADKANNEESNQLISTVAKAREAGNGRWNITTADGAVWQSTEPLIAQPQPGDALEIKNAALGGYFMKIKNRRAVRARRVE